MSDFYLTTLEILQTLMAIAGIFCAQIVISRRKTIELKKRTWLMVINLFFFIFVTVLYMCHIFFGYEFSVYIMKPMNLITLTLLMTNMVYGGCNGRKRE